MIRTLAIDLPNLWKARTTTTADRKGLLRLVIDKVTVAVDPDTERVDVIVHWAGGNETTARLRRPVGKLTQLKEHKNLVAEIHALRRAGYTAERIAEKLNEAEWVTPTQRSSFNGRLIRAMMHRHGSVPRGPKAPPTDDPNDRRLADLANELGMPLVTLYGWLRRGWLWFARRSASRTSFRPSSYATRRSGLTSTWYCFVSPPVGITCATPATARRRRRITQSAVVLSAIAS